MFAHLSNIGEIEEGQEINPGTHIGDIGNTGNSEGPHLHYSVRASIKEVEKGNVVLSEEAKKNALTEHGYYYLDPYIFLPTH